MNPTPYGINKNPCIPIDPGVYRRPNDIMLPFLESVVEKIRNAPSYPKLENEMFLYRKSVHVPPFSWDKAAQDHWEQSLERPDRFLCFAPLAIYVQVQSALNFFSEAVFKETGLPREAETLPRGMNGVNWEQIELDWLYANPEEQAKLRNGEDV